MALDRLKSRCSIRGRVAFALALAERCVELLKHDNVAYQLARNALDDAWMWEEGAVVSGDRLSGYLENAEDESLVAYESMAPERAKPGFAAIITAVAYVAWHAYIEDHESALMSESINEVSEAALDDIVALVEASTELGPRFVDRVADYIANECASESPLALGQPVARLKVVLACAE